MRPIVSSRRGRPTRPTTRLGVEALEARQLLASNLPVTHEAAAARTPTQVYVGWITGALTDEPMGEATKKSLVRRIDAGWSRERAAAFVLRSDAGRRAEIESVYEAILKRDPTGGETAWYLAQARRGADQLLVIRNVVKSREYFETRAGGTNAGWILAASNDLLGRDPSVGESSAWLAALEGGTTRGRLTNAILRSPQYVEAATRRLARARAEGALEHSDLIHDLTDAWKGPQGLTRAKARLFGSDSFLDRLLNPPPRPTPPKGLPSVGVPLTPKFSVATGWTEIDPDQAINQLQSFGAAPTGEYWLGSADGLVSFDAVTSKSTPIWGGVALSVAPISATEGWVVGADSFPPSSIYVARVKAGAAATQAPALPGGDVPSQVGASPDGTVWALAQSGAVYSYAAGAWTAVPSNGFAIRSLTVGSASNIWALATVQGSGAVLKWTSGAGWSVDAEFNSTNPSAISATADGTVFAVANVLGQKVFIRQAGGTWGEVPNQTPPAGILLIAAADRNRMLAFAGEDFQLLSVGLVDRPPVAFPKVTSQWDAGYDAVTVALKLANSNGLGLRGMYGDAVSSDLETWQIQLSNHELTLPSGFSVDPANWIAIQEQLGAELSDVLAVDSLFDTLNKVNADVDTVNTSTLSNALTRVALTTDEQSTSKITLAIEAMFEAAVAGVATLFTGTGATIAAVLASAFDNAVADLTGSPDPDDDTKLTETYLKLSSALGSLFVDTGTTYASQWDKFVGTATTLGDYGILTALGDAINSGLWYIPVGEAQTIAAAAKPAFETYFYQALVPSKWQIVYDLQVICDLYNCPDFKAPDYDQYVVLISGGGNDSLVNYYFANQIGSATDPYHDAGPYPSSDLLDHLWSIGVAKADFFTNANGQWNITFVAAS